MKNKDVIIAFSHRERARNSTGSLWTTGDCLYSYYTCIAEYNREGYLYMNDTRYSVTTSKHQSLCRRYLSVDEFVYGIERNKTHIINENERIYL